LDQLYSGDFPRVNEAETVILGQSIVRGDVLGKITASGKLTKMVAAAGDGSENFYAVAVEDIDASAADKVGIVGKTGSFNETVLTFGAATTIADVDKDAARGLGCFFKPANF
jgi:hypothetical protein